MQRRNFIKNTCNLCMIGAAGLMAPQLAGCSSAKYSVYKTEVNNKNIEVPVSLFTESSLQIVRPTGWYRDIALQKENDGTYSALLLECTHQENALTITGNGFHCSLHGSDFDRSGRVRKGPAEVSLTRYKTSLQNDKLIIHV